MSMDLNQVYKGRMKPRAGFEPAGVPLCRRMRWARLCHLGASEDIAEARLSLAVSLVLVDDGGLEAVLCRSSVIG